MFLQANFTLSGGGKVMQFGNYELFRADVRKDATLLPKTDKRNVAGVLEVVNPHQIRYGGNNFISKIPLDFANSTAQTTETGSGGNYKQLFLFGGAALALYFIFKDN